MRFIVAPVKTRTMAGSCSAKCSANCVAKCGSLGTCFCPFEKK